MGIFKRLLGYKDIVVSADMPVGDLREKFKEQFGIGIRVYKLNAAGEIFTGRGAKKAPDDATLSSVSKGHPGSVTLKKSMTVNQVESAFAETMGVGVQVEDIEGGLAANTSRIGDLAQQ